MNLFQWFKNKIYSLVHIKKLNGTPNDNRLTFISDDEAIFIEKIRANKVWYYGDGDEILNYYTGQVAFGWLSNPIYNRNKRNYFWGLSATECDIKRVHCGIPKAIIDTTTNIIGKPTISSSDNRLKEILKVNNFMFKLTQQYRPMTLVEGDGCLKINFNKKLSKHPIFEYYGAEDWQPIVAQGILLGLMFKNYYKDAKGRNYVLIETRTLDEDGCLIEWNLYRLGKQNELSKVEFDAIPELQQMKTENRKHVGIRKLFATPLIYFYNPLRENRGKSIYDGKLDLFDMMDEIWSQSSQTNRVSTPVEYYPTDILERTKDGQPILPKKYNRQFIGKSGMTDGDGINKSGQIVTTQPELNFDKYGLLYNDVLSCCLIGILSPSSLGIDVAKKDNADAQREKEKQSIFTRNNIIDSETNDVKDFLEMALMIQDYLDFGEIKEENTYEISVEYNEFANPSFESELQILGPAWSQGQISTKQFVKILWAGKLNAEDMQAEIDYLEQNKQKDDIDLEAMMHEGPIKPNIPTTENKEEEPSQPQE